MVTPTGTGLPWQGIDLTSLFAFSEVSIPSDMPSVHRDYLGLNEPVGEPDGHMTTSRLTAISSRTDFRAIGG